jgi:hypothetical protein
MLSLDEGIVSKHIYSGALNLNFGLLTRPLVVGFWLVPNISEGGWWSVPDSGLEPGAQGRFEQLFGPRFPGPGSWHIPWSHPVT